MQFQLGEQPIWIGKEECTLMKDDFIPTLLGESPASSLISRGYAVVKISEKMTHLYSQFHQSFEIFSHSTEEHKKTYATLFTKDTFSPNQFHGFSVVTGLKEQFMMRVSGRENNLFTPGNENGIDLGVTGMNLYQELDQMCRRYEYEVMKNLGLDSHLVDKILDPVFKVDTGASREGDSLVCCSDYVLPNYISSSIMDNFHYFNSIHTTTKVEDKEQFHNNHASHSDSGLMTAVVVTDEPGLEVFDQKLKCWIALEQVLHKYLKDQGPLAHRQYATIFWGDSHVYLKANLHECMHRVATSKGERYSVVFKQRTSPTATAPRYQEDYELALVQLKSIDAAKK